MALTLTRWLLLAAAGALIVLTMSLGLAPGEVRGRGTRQVVEQAEQRAQFSAARAADQLRLVQIRDSLVPVFSRLPRSDSTRVLFDRSIPSDVRTALAAKIKSAQGSASTSTPHPMDVAVVVDSATRVRGVARSSPLIRSAVVLPASPGEPCRVIIRLRHPRPGDAVSPEIRDRVIPSIVPQRLLGPCAFIHAFGMPGPEIERWLQQVGWSYAATVDWSRPPRRWQPPWWAQEQGFGAGSALRRFISLPGYRCAGGDETACTGVLVGGDRRAGTGSAAWAGRFVSLELSERPYWRGGSLGPQDDWLLSEMVRTLGQQRFQRFWSSELPVAEAFRAASDEDLGSWTRQWAGSQYGSAHPRGPSLPPASAAAALVLVVIAGGGATWATRRRQVT